MIEIPRPVEIKLGEITLSTFLTEAIHAQYFARTKDLVARTA
jgi:hypothetical protein